MSHICYDCKKSYANKGSLASHISRYHRSKDNSNKTGKKVLLPHPTFGNNVPKFGENPNYDNLSESSEDITKTRKRSNRSEESDSDTEPIVKRTKTIESNDEKISKLFRVVAKLIKEINQVQGTFSKVAKDMDKVEDKADENKRNINRERILKQVGSGIDTEMKRFYHKIMNKNPNLIKDIKETKKTVDSIQQHTFFKEYLKENDKLKKELIKLEEYFINAMEIKQLLNGTVDDIRFKIKELKNATHVAKTILELSEDEELILKVIIYSSKIQVMDLLDEWFHNIKFIFDRLPSDEDLKNIAKEFTKEYKLFREKELKIKRDLCKDTDDKASDISESDSNEDADDEASEFSESDSSDNKESKKKSQDSKDADDEASEITEVSNSEDDENKVGEESVNGSDDASEGNSKDDDKSENVTDGNDTDKDTDNDDGVSDTSTENMI